MLPESTYKELRNIKLMAQAVVDMADRLIEVKEKPVKKKADVEFEKFWQNRMKTRLQK